MGDTIICMAEAEPAGFHVDGTAASIRLAFEVAGKVIAKDGDDDRSRKEQAASDAFKAFLGRLKDVHFKAYTIGQDKITEAAADISVPQAFDPKISSRFFDWLSASSAKKVFFAAPAPGNSTVTESQIGATETMFGAGTWTAPLPHNIGLAQIVRLKGQQGPPTDLMMVPYFGAAALDASYAVRKQTDPVSGELIYEFEYKPYDGADAGVEVTCRNTRVVPIVDDPSSLIKYDTGFLYGDSEGEKIHRAVVRFEQRGGAALSTFPVMLLMAWPWKDDRPDTPPPVEPGKPVPINDETFIRRLIWRAVTTLVVALDPIMIALRTPGNDRREGPLLSVLFDQLASAVEEKIEKYNMDNADHPIQSPGNANLLKVLKDAVAALPLYRGGTPPAKWGELLKFVFEFAGTPAEQGQNERLTPTLAVFLKTFDGSKTIAELMTDFRKLFAKPTEDSNKQPISFYALELRDGTLNTRLNADLGKIADALAGEGSMERLIGRVLQCVGATGQPAFDERLNAGIKALLPLLPDNPNFAANVRAGLEKFLSNKFNGAEAVRQACGSIYVDTLLKKWPATVDDLEQSLIRTKLFEQRLLAHNFAGNPLGDVLGILSNPAIDLSDGLDISRWTTPMFADVVAELFVEKPENRFLPTAAPLPLPLQITVDQSTASLDNFNSQFAGVGLLIRRLDKVDETGLDLGWAYSSLAELKLSGAAPPAIPTSLEPLLPGEIDGRRQLYLEYAGLPFTTAAFVDTLPAAQADKGAPFYTMDFPEKPFPKTLPRLAYGREFDVVGHVVSKGGILPKPLQKDTDLSPWLPSSTIDLTGIDGSFNNRDLVQNFKYSRTTSIGRTLIRDREKTVPLIGASIDNTRPLSVDYPRVGFASDPASSRFLDIMRNSDGSGAIAIPAKDTSASIRIKDVLIWGDDHELTFGIHRDVKALADDTPLGKVRLSDGSTRIIDTLDIVISEVARDSEDPGAIIGTFRLAVRADGATLFDDIIHYGSPIASIWLRLSLEPTASSCAVSLADPVHDMNGTAAASRPMPGSLLLIGNDTPGMGRKSNIKVDLVFPRVGFLDFERWLNNDDLRQKTYGNNKDLLEVFRLALSVAYSARLSDRRLSTLLDRLPDLAVEGVRLELTPLDSLRDSLDHEVKSGALWTGKRVYDIPLAPLGDQLAKLASAPKNIDLHDVLPRIGEWLELLNDALSREIEIICAGSALSVTESQGNLQITIPQGMCVRLTARPLVNATYFSGQNGYPAVIDQRLRQYALGSVIDNGGTLGAVGSQYEVFDGATVTLEAMIGPIAIAVDDRSMPWLAIVNNDVDRNDWAELVAAAFQHSPIGTARAYDVCLAPEKLKTTEVKKTKPWRWRQLGYVDLQTQRWRFTGRPIYSWFDPGKPDAGAFSRVLEKGHEPSQLAAFESEAFADRLDIDADVNTITLLPEPSVSTILRVNWEKPSATLFRHRFVVRSRYAGAMSNRRTSETNAWHDVGKGPKDWFRVAMLADRSRLQLTRPQLRALIPLTSAPNELGSIGASPPVLAILQEHPFEHGGLADRVSTEIRTGFSYKFTPPTGGHPQDAKVEPFDARKEAGPSPTLAYQSLPLEEALALVLPAEGPVGLTFDSSTVAAPAFPNAMYVLQPSSLKGSLEPVPSDMEEHFLSVALRRYLDVRWLRAETENQNLSQGTTAAIGAKREIPLHQCCWITFQSSGAGKLHLELDNGTEFDICSFGSTGGMISACVDPRALDSTVTNNLDPLKLFSIQDSGRRFALLHVPLEEKRSSLSIFVLPSTSVDYSRQLSGSGNLPLLLASFDWTIPKKPDAKVNSAPADNREPNAVLSCDGAHEVLATSASALTSMNWTRISRDFDRIQIQYGKDQKAIPVSSLVLEEKNKALTIGALVDSKPVSNVWIYPRPWMEPMPLHLQRHIALLETWRDERFGTPAEEFKSLRRLTGRAPVAIGEKPDGTSRLMRVVEFETPAVILGYLPDGGATMPALYRTGFFDFRAIGLNPASQPERSPVLSLFMRLVASSFTRSRLKRLALWIGMRPDRADDGKPYRTLINFDRTGGPGMVVGLRLKLTNTSTGWESATSILSDDGSVSTPVVSKYSVGFDPFQNPDGLRLSIASVNDGTEAEGWLEVSLLAGVVDSKVDPVTGTTIPDPDPDKVSFDWFFTADSSSPGEAVTPAGLSKMVEAQARIVAISPPAVVSGS